MHPATARLVGLGVVAVLAASAALAQQQRPAEAPRSAPLTPAQIRQQGTQRAALVAEWESLFADPQVAVRLVAFREGTRHPDPVIRELALRRGLTSDEADILEISLRGLVSGTRHVIMRFAGPDGAVREGNGAGQLRFEIAAADVDSGAVSGPLAVCYGNAWTGRIQRNEFSFIAGASCTGTLTWNAEAGQFQGRINVSEGRADGFRDVVWKPN